MTDLRKLARDRPCLVRVPGYCEGGRETVVLAHYRLPGLSGMGIKSEDVFGAYACYRCHAVCDGQMKSEYTHDQRSLMLAEGVFRTQKLLINEGMLRW